MNCINLFGVRHGRTCAAFGPQSLPLAAVPRSVVYLGRPARVFRISTTGKARQVYCAGSRIRVGFRNLSWFTKHCETMNGVLVTW